MGVRIAPLFFLLLASAAFAKEPAVPQDSRFNKVDDIITSAIAQKVMPGAVLIIGTPDKILWQKAYGHYTYEPTAKAMTLDTLFDMASVSKVVGTATAAMALLEEGKIKLDDPVAKYIPAFASHDKGAVTLQDLLTHVSGLPPYVAAAKAEKERKPGMTTADAMINCIANLAPTTAPRTRVIYSCLNAQTMARVNETVLNGRQDDFLKEKVYGPLGMKDTCYLLSDDQKSRCAPTTIRPDGKLLCAEAHDPIANYHSAKDHCPGNAGVFSTGPDLARYCSMILKRGELDGKRVFKPETIDQMTAVQTPEWIHDLRGLGWDIYTSAPWTTSLNQTNATRVIGHTGFTGTLIWLDKNTKTYVVFLTHRVFPNGIGEEDQRLTPVRKQICDLVLRAQDAYKDYYAAQDAQKSAKDK